MHGTGIASRVLAESFGWGRIAYMQGIDRYFTTLEVDSFEGSQHAGLLGEAISEREEPRGAEPTICWSVCWSGGKEGKPYCTCKPYCTWYAKLTMYRKSFFSIPFIIFDLLFSLPPINSRNSDPGSHRRLFFPLPTKVCTLHFYRGKTSALSSSVDSRRVTPTNARSTPQLILFQFWK